MAGGTKADAARCWLANIGGQQEHNIGVATKN
jgi:hypothetical protein